MSGGGKKTETVQKQESVGPWKPAQPLLQNILGQAQGLLGNTGINPTENAALTGLASNAATMGNYAPQLQGLTDKLFAGGGLGAGIPGLQQAWDIAQGTLGGIASGNLDPTQNPQMAQMIQQITDQARNAVGSQFAGAGRSFSGAHAGATGKAITEGLAPTLFNQYNQNVQNAMGASQGLLQGAQGTSQGLDNAYGNQLNAQLQAPGSLANMNTPQMAALQAEAMRRGLPISNLQDLNSLILPIAQTGREGSSTATGTVSVKNDPWQTGLGAGLGILGTAGKLGILSDARAKENARPVGATFDGQTIYAFNYKGDAVTHIGLMAQEVAEKHPDAVFEGPHGFLMVDYAKATAGA